MIKKTLIAAALLSVASFAAAPAQAHSTVHFGIGLGFGGFEPGYYDSSYYAPGYYDDYGPSYYDEEFYHHRRHHFRHIRHHRHYWAY